MKRIGISISKDRLSAFAWEKTALSGRPLAAFEVACSEPYGSAEDLRSLASKAVEALGTAELPPSVVSLPPGEYFLRFLDLPVADLKRARLIHAAELEGTLPIEGEEIVSDLVPMGADLETGGRYAAFATRRETVERIVQRFSDAGLPVESIVTDPVSLIVASSVLVGPVDHSVASFETEVILLDFKGAKLTGVRQFPAGITSDPALFGREAGPLLAAHAPLYATGLMPPEAAAFIKTPPEKLLPPGGFQYPSAIAFGAALVPSLPKVANGFNLAVSGSTPDDETRRGARLRIAAVAAFVAIAACILALELARWTAAKQVAAARKQLRTEFTAAVPETKNVVRETAQLREKIASLKRQRDELGLDLPRITPLLAQVSGALPQGKSLTVKEISIDGARMRIAGDSTGGSAVEGYRAALAASLGKGYAVTVQESRGSARGDSVSFTILIERGKAGNAS
jgi:type II secretion system protein L